MLRGMEPCSWGRSINNSKSFNIILNEDDFSICFRIRNDDSYFERYTLTDQYF